MPKTFVAADLHLALDVGGDLAAEVTLDLQVAVDVGAQLRNFFFGEVTHAGVARMPTPSQISLERVRPTPKM